MNKTLLAIACACMVIAVLSPIVSFIYFSDRLSDVSESYELKISHLLEANEKLKRPILSGAYLVTELGWYLHNSSDPSPASRNQLTIYGTISNVGAKNAKNCILIIDFYDNTSLLESAKSNLGSINSGSHIYIRRKIPCSSADSVTKVEVERTWENIP